MAEQFRFISRLAREQKGATAIEYGLVAALIALVVIVSLPSIATVISRVLETLAEAIRG